MRLVTDRDTEVHRDSVELTLAQGNEPRPEDRSLTMFDPNEDEWNEEWNGDLD